MSNIPFPQPDRLIRQHVRDACYWEATAPKLGNVHPQASFEDLTYDHFLKAGEITAELLAVCSHHGYGHTVFEAVRLCRKMVKTNANLGIILLLTPLAMIPAGTPIEAGIGPVIDQLDIEETVLLYDAIRLANPGGLGEVNDHDVRTAPTLGVRSVMALAADRDQIAKAYADDYDTLLCFGVPRFCTELKQFEQDWSKAVVSLQLHWLAFEPDSLIARKCGPQMANEVQQQAKSVLDAGGLQTPEGRDAAERFDEWLRSDKNRRNPGTTADLIAATLYIAIREQLVTPAK